LVLLKGGTQLVSDKKRIVIVGGVAGGASAAARARRVSEDAEIILFERGPHVSFANCGLPYYIGGEIERSESLVLETPERLGSRFNMDVRILTEVMAINREAKTVTVRSRVTGAIDTVSYDALLLSPGAKPFRPPIPGIDLPGHFTLRNVPETIEISEWIKKHEARRAVVVGGGYIGLEMAEQLVGRALNVSIVEAGPQIMGVLDPEMAALLQQELVKHGVHLYLNESVEAFNAANPDIASASVARLKSGKQLPADLVVIGIGVRPEVTLARNAGLEIGELGGIRVNSSLQTSDPNIWAVGDAIEVKNGVTGEWILIPLAGPANRQGRIAADNILGRKATYDSTLGTGILRLFGLTAGCTGATERALNRQKVAYHAIHLHPNSHAGYYPGASTLSIKLLFAPETGRILGAQVIGRDGADKRTDVLAAALRSGMTVHDLAEMELAYAPPFGSAKDPVNLAGMMAENVLNGDVATIQWYEMDGLDPEKTVILDVRQPDEFAGGALPGAILLPLPDLRQRLEELPKEKEIVTYCQGGQRGYYACRILAQNGYRCRNLSGAYLTWSTATQTEGEQIDV